MKIYDEIVKAAKQKKISINTLEKKAGVSAGSVCKWNEVSPSVRSLKKVASELGCTVDDLLQEGD
ncbi:MAG: helix-turn-helix domain-containing protein [Lachnospiraceae bacterium]